jgi:branched-chain amino acid transport system ATP-binding protein
MFRPGRGEIATLIGANGAGKSTTLKTISGLLRFRTGTAATRGSDPMPAQNIVKTQMVRRRAQNLRC